MEEQIRENGYIFDVKIPGFKAGTYEVGMPGREYIILKCMGNNSSYINGTTSHSKKKNLLFDLQGRRLSGKPARGIYIEGGKKVKY